MRRYTTAITAAVAAFVASTAVASAQHLHVVGQHDPWLAPAERAISKQQPAVQSRWHTPRIKWTTNGWPVYIGTVAQLKRWHAYRPEVAYDPGYHKATVTWNGHKYVYHPFMVINMTVEKHNYERPSAVLNHEVDETLVDPTTQRFINGNEVEVCDPVYTSTYHGLGGVQLEDFVYPSYFHNRSHGPYDYLHVLKHGIGAAQLKAPDVVVP